MLSVFESWINRLKRGLSTKESITLSQGKRRDISLRLVEKARGQELMDCYILWGANSGEIGQSEIGRNVSREEF
jgi:hypothetical protein